MSEAIYFVAIIALALILARPVYGVYAASQERSAQAVASGLAAMIDSMSPGTSVVTSLESYPGVDLSVALSGNSVSASFGSSSSSSHVRWALPHESLTPGEEYNFTLTGSEIAVWSARDG